MKVTWRGNSGVHLGGRLGGLCCADGRLRDDLGRGRPSFFSVALRVASFRDMRACSAASVAGLGVVGKRTLIRGRSGREGEDPILF